MSLYSRDELEWDLSAHVLKFLAATTSLACIAADLWMQLRRQQRCVAAKGVGDGMLAKRGASGHHCDDLADRRA